MACSQQPKEESSCSPPTAVIGCFLTDDAGNVYGLVNRHVTLLLKDCFKIVNKDSSSVMFGSPVSTKNSSDENLLLYDIDLIKINDEYKLRCKSVFQTSTNETASSYKKYDHGKIKDMYNAKAHMCFTSEETVKKTNVLKGTISELPQSLVDCYSTDNYFMFKRQSDQPCAFPGQIGTIIAKDGDHGAIELVGIIAHGDINLKCTQPLNKETIGIESCSKVDVTAIKSTTEGPNDGITSMESDPQFVNKIGDSANDAIVNEPDDQQEEMEKCHNTNITKEDNSLVGNVKPKETQTCIRAPYSSNDSICLLLNEGINFLEKKYNLKLTIYPGAASDVDTIKCGCRYTFRPAD